MIVVLKIVEAYLKGRFWGEYCFLYTLVRDLNEFVIPISKSTNRYFLSIPCTRI